MRPIKRSAVVFILANVLCFGVFAEDAVKSDSFQRVKQELWAFGPESRPLDSPVKDGPKADSVEASRVEQDSPEHIPEELSRALVKYSVEL